MTAGGPAVRTVRIRSALQEDAADLSALVVETLRTSNAADYAPEIIARLSANFDPTSVAAMIATRRVLVAVDGERLLGTGALDGTTIRTVFVRPDAQGRGTGRALVAELARMAEAAGLKILGLRSSITARGFYARLGFRVVGEATFGDERTVVMRRDLHPPLAPGREV